MTADSVDLEECDNHFKGVVGSLFNEDDLVANSYLNAPYRKFPAPTVFQNKYTSSMYDLNEMFMPSSYVLPFETSLDLYNFPKYGSDFFEQSLPFESLLPTAEEEEQIRQKISDSFNSYMMPTYENSSHSDVESEIDYFLVSPDAVLPSKHTNEVDIGPLDSMWPELGGLSDEKLVKIVHGGYLENLAMDDMFVKKKRRKLTHLDIDHCYSQRLPVEDDYEDEDEDFFNSSPCSPASSSCSDRLVETRGVKRTRPKRKNVRRKKIKQEVTSSEDEEVDVETPCSVPLVVPKITISISPALNPPRPRRGRKPKDKSGQNVKKTNIKNYPVPPKVLQAAIQQQKKKCYITKSGRVTKISNSVETTPSTSVPSSISNSRSNSDNEDNVDKRASHNKAERHRRQELTNLFRTLRETVPKIADNTKASKVLILTGAVNEVERFEKELKELKKLKSEMRKKVALVQSLLNRRGCSS